jgi:hypothetical protein
MNPRRVEQLRLPLHDLAGDHVNFSQSGANILSPMSAANATLALYAAEWFLLGLLITAPFRAIPSPIRAAIHLSASPNSGTGESCLTKHP